ncbi:MAG: hypothetical protein K9M11_02250 [Candidatus Pacebacteria bacterium]|nr:hypothetical protein [Candidatus Paceibacterota bacterium]
MKNNKNIIISVIVVIVLLVLGLSWNSSRKNTENLDNSGEMQATSTETTNSSNGAGVTSSKPIKNSTNPSTGSNQTSQTPSNPTTPSVTACTMDARICPDGSAVGRSGPSCEFSACPGGSTSGNTTGNPYIQTSAALNQTIIIGGVYITPIKVVSDSRCPSDVTCVWAGEAKIMVHLVKNNVSEDVEITSGSSISFRGSTVSLVEVQPQQKSRTSILDKNYVFTFRVI